MPEKTYRAFISYSHADKNWAKWLHRALETYSVPRHLVGMETATGTIPERLTPVFRDQDELPSAADLSKRIRDALNNSENLIVICSPRAALSTWVDREIETFKQLGRSNRIFSLIVEGDPAAKGTDADCLPPCLRVGYDSSGAKLAAEVEPIAADVRREGDGRALARLKIISGLLGLGLDELRQRELQRKHRRMAAITVASVGALMVTAMLAVSANLARNEADSRRAQAEDLLSFMVGDLRESLAPIGRLDLLEKVGEKALGYFATVKAEDLTDEELSRHAQVLTQLGEIRVSQHQYDNALLAFLEAYERSSELNMNDARDGGRLFRRGQAEFWVGYVYWRRGEFAQARDWLTRYRDTSQLLSDLDPGREDWRREVVYGHHNLAVLAYEFGDLKAATAGFNAEWKALVEMQKSNIETAIEQDVADVISWLGSVSVQQGKLTQARRYFEQSADKHEALRILDPDNADHSIGWAHALQRIVETTSIMGDVDTAELFVNKAISLFEGFVAKDEHNREWMRALAQSWTSKGTILAMQQNKTGARKLAERSLDTLNVLISEEPSDVETREQLVQVYRLNALLAVMDVDREAAMNSNELALEHIQTIANAGRLNDERLGMLGSTIVAQGRLQADAGDHKQAEVLWQQAVSLLESRARKSQSPHLLDPWVRALFSTGEHDEAQALETRLAQSGYQPKAPWPWIAN